MKKADEETIKNLEIPSIILMENASIALYEVIKREFPEARKFLILAGRGNNGGDGLGLVRHLSVRGYQVDYILCLGEELKGDAKVQYGILKKLGKHPIEDANFEDYDLLVDALLGTGFEPPVRGLAKEWIERMSKSKVPILSVDIPSGLSADTPELFHPHVKAKVTLTFAFPKICHVFYPSAKACGKTYVANISIPEACVSYVKRELIRHVNLPKREPDVHKGDMGHILLVGSSIGKTGALIMSAKSATRTGSGLVSVGVPQDLNHIFEVALVEEMSIPLDGQKRLSPSCVSQILSMQDKFSALGLGMGMDRYKEGQDIVRGLISRWEKPLLLDADALNNLADSKNLDALRERRIPAVLTPHVGEFSRLTGYSKEEVLRNPVDLSVEFSQRYNCYLVLKSSRTVIATPDGWAYVSMFGTPAMAKGGVGDVLSGILTSLMGRGMDLLEALKLGVVLHGLSGQIVAEEKHTESLKAMDMVEAIPKAYNLIENGNYSPPLFCLD